MQRKFIAHMLSLIAVSAIIFIFMGVVNAGYIDSVASIFSNNGSTISAEHVSDQALERASPNAAFKRVSINPNSDADLDLLMAMGLDVQHEFSNGVFTAHVSKKMLEAMEGLATLEDVPLYQLTVKPVCGNGIPEGAEKCGEPGLSCSGDLICENCKCVGTSEPEPPAVRACYPTVQREYNVVQVNGGQLGDGEGINVAVLDTGIDTNHLDLVDNITICVDTTKRGIKNGCEDKDGVAHGTHSAGIVGASGGADGLGLFGVAPSVNLQIVKVCGPAGCYTDDIAAAIDYVAANGAHIVNMSLGGNVESGLLRDAIARHPEVLFVAAAGNDGPLEGSIDYPGANPAVIAVAAIDTDKIVTSFSSRGINDGDDLLCSVREVELATGGYSVLSTNKDGCYSHLHGTSFSSPTVAGLAAKVWIQGGGTVDTVRAYLRTLVEDITLGESAGVGYDIASGYGLPVAP